jgi:hypothetical protein
MNSNTSPRSSSTSVFRTSITLLLLAVFGLQVGCSRSPETSPWTLEQGRLLEGRILHRDVEEARVVADGVERYGRVLVKGDEQASHEVAFYVRQELVRGDGQTVIDIVDEETGSRSLWVMNDETGEAHVTTESGELNLVFNADGTIVVGDQFAANEQEAGKLIHETGVMESVSDYTFTVLLDTISKYLPEEETGRGQAVVAVVVVVWLTASTVACSREFSRNGCRITTSMSQYCRDYCRQVGCFCW